MLLILLIQEKVILVIICVLIGLYDYDCITLQVEYLSDLLLFHNGFLLLLICIFLLIESLQFSTLMDVEHQSSEEADWKHCDCKDVAPDRSVQVIRQISLQEHCAQRYNLIDYGEGKRWS